MFYDTQLGIVLTAVRYFEEGEVDGLAYWAVARGGCLIACNFGVTRSTVLTEEETARPDMTLPLH
jgi:hypothetical protein